MQRDGDVRLALARQALANRPLKVSGVVVDEEGKPVPAASVGYNSSRKIGSTEARTLLSKEDGTFAIVGEDGMEMHVSAWHDDYLSVPESFVFVAPRASLLKRHGSVDSGGFVTLVLRKKPPSAGLTVVSARREFGPETWTLTFDMGTGQTRVGEPIGSQEVAFHLELGEGAGPTIERKFDWKVTLRVPGGGAQARTDLKGYEAPENGYEEPLVVSFDSAAARWAYVMERDVFVRLADGTYGRLNYRVSAHLRQLTVSGFRNPTGSRNLYP